MNAAISTNGGSGAGGSATLLGVHSRHVMDVHDDLAHPLPSTLPSQHTALPTRADRERTRSRLTLIRNRPAAGPPDDMPIEAAAAAAAASTIDTTPYSIFLHAREMHEQGDAAYLKGVEYRRDALWDWVVLLVLRVVVFVMLAIRGARTLLYVETLLILLYDVPTLLGAVWLMQPMIVYAFASSVVHVGWTLAVAITWYTTYMFSSHHRHFNGGATVGWIGFFVIVGELCIVVMQMRNFANILDALLLNSEIVTTMADVAQSATHDKAFQYNATEAGHALASGASAASTSSSSPPVLSTSPSSSAWVTRVPILGRLFMMSSSPLSAAATAVDHHAKET